MRVQSIIALILCALVASPGFGQTSQTPEITYKPSNGFFSRLTRNYSVPPIRSTSYADSSRIENLMRAGSIYLSLRDAIALALENNLDIESARYTPLLSDANLLRARAGTLLRNVPTSISSGPSSSNLGALAGASVGSAGVAAAGTGNQGGILSGLSIQGGGSQIPNLDPTFFVTSQYTHTTQIQTARNIAGTNTVITSYKTANYGIQQGFTTGTTVGLSASNQLGVNQNSPASDYNPFTQASLTLSIQQNLLQAFRPSVNKRFISQAKNQRHISDLTFKNQVMATVMNVVDLYWDLVSFNEYLKIRQQTLDLNTKLYNDNKRRAELGAIAPIDIIQAEAEMKASQQQVTNAETQVLQQEMILKSVLTRSGMDNLTIINARIIPTDHFEIPIQEQVRPIQDLLTEALANRPDVAQNTISLENSRLNMKGTRDAMLPQLQAFVNASNNALVGQVNHLPYPVIDPNTGSLLGTVQRTPADVNPFFLGGYGSILSQLFSRNFPNYTAGIQLSIPIHNRQAQADFITDALNYRQQQIQDKQLRNNIKLNVVNARTALSQARAAYDTAVEARKLQDQTLAGTRRKYELGTSTILDVVITQRDATARELDEATALNQYIRSRVSMDNVLGEILNVYDVDIDEALSGNVKRQPDLIPPIGKR